MSAETLRRAAALMRERAEAATPGPWTAAASGIEGAGTVFHDSHVLHNDADHIASWHPAVALAVADLLAQHAEDHLSYDCRWDPCAALAVARTYLGETA